MCRGRPFGHRIWASLPPTPFFPESARAEVVLRIEQGLAVKQTSALLSGDLAILPPTLTPARVVHEYVILDDKSFHRSRSWPEALAWVALLGGAPPLILVGLFRRWRRDLWTKSGVAFVLLIAVYAATPLGLALSRVLAGK